MSNILIVESHNDQYFIQALLNHLNLNFLDIDSPICAIDDYECLNGLDKAKLESALKRLKNRLLKPKAEPIEKVGIIIDLDQESVENRLKLVNSAIQEVFTTELAISQVNHWITVPVDAEVSVEISCYFMNVGGSGELETVLKAIKSQDSTYADCLEKWRECIQVKHQISEKDFDKFWVSVYQRFDCCNDEDKKQAGKKCDNEASFKKKIGDKTIYDFDSSVLAKLREFLISFNSRCVEV